MKKDMNGDPLIGELADFIEKSPTAYHGVEQMAERLEAAGFAALNEGDHWRFATGGKYYVTRNGSALIAFRLPKGRFGGFQIVASHGDSPIFKLKPAPEMATAGDQVRLNVELYGGALLSPWFDRPLSVAGRVLVREGDTLTSRLVNLDRDLCLIPSLAIHMDREANKGHAWNVQKDLLPLYGQGDCEPVLAAAARELGVAPEAIAGSDLYVYNRDGLRRWGAHGEFISGPRLDDLQCAFASLTGILQAEPTERVAVHCCFDNEEVGSGTKQGAAGTFLADTLSRIADGLGKVRVDYHRVLADSFMLSADNAHGVHPNAADKADPVNRPRLNGGVVIKHSANQKYTTDGVSAAVCRMLCEAEGVPCQDFANRSDMAGGSTLGNISTTQVSLNTADIGLAQLAMHSPFETAGAADTGYLAALCRRFYETSFTLKADGRYGLRLKEAEEADDADDAEE